MSAVGVCASGATDVMGEGFFGRESIMSSMFLGGRVGFEVYRIHLMVGVIESSDWLLVL